MAGRGSVKLSIYSTFKDDGTKKAERALAQFAKKFGEVDKATGKLKLNSVSKQLAEQSIKWDRLSQKCARFSTALGKASKAFAPFSAAAAGALGGSIKLAADYETAMGKVATIMDKSQVSVEDMGSALLDLSTQTGRSATELAEAAYQAQSASVSTKNTVSFVEQAAKLSKAGFTETATAVDTLTTILNAYKLSEEETAAIADKLVNTQNKGKTTVDQLSQSIGQAIPTAAAYNVNLDNLLSSYVILTKQGINTANATTYLNGMMTELAKEGTKVSDSLQELTGKSFSELMASGYSLGDVLGILYDSVDGDATAFANLWGNVRAGRGALALAQAGTEGFNAELAGMAQSAGTVDSALEDLETPAAKAQKALNALKNTGILLGQEVLVEVAPALEKMVEGSRKLFESFKKLPSSTKQSIVKFLAVTAALAPLLKLMSTGFGIASTFAHGMATASAGLAKFASGGGAAAKFAGAFGKLLKGPVVLGIMAAVAAIALIVKNMMDWKKKQENLNKATEKLRSVTKPLKPTLSQTADAMAEMGKKSEIAAMSVDELTEAQAELADTIAERNAEASTSIARLEAAKQVIDQYANQTGLSAEEQGRLQAAIALVNEECGTQYEVTDAVNGKIQDENGEILNTVDAIDQYIEAKKKQIQVDLISENLKDLYAQQGEAIKTAEQAQEDYNAAVDDFAAHKGDKDWQLYADAVDAAQANLDTANGELSAVNDSIAQQEGALGMVATKSGEAAKSLEDLVKGDYRMTSFELPEDEVENFIAWLEEAGYSMEDYESLTTEELVKLVAAWRTSGKKITGEMDKTSSKATASGKKTSLNFASGILSNISAATSAASLVSSSAKGKLSVDTYSAGQTFTQGFSSGISSLISSAVTAAANMAQAAVDAAKAKIKPGSPSKVMREYGEVFGQGFEKGIKDTTGDVASAARGMANAAIDQFGGSPGFSGTGYGSVTNVYINGNKVNDDPAVKAAFLDFMGELHRLSYA